MEKKEVKCLVSTRELEKAASPSGAEQKMSFLVESGSSLKWSTMKFSFFFLFVVAKQSDVSWSCRASSVTDSRWSLRHLPSPPHCESAHQYEHRNLLAQLTFVSSPNLLLYTCQSPPSPPIKKGTVRCSRVTPPLPNPSQTHAHITRPSADHQPWMDEKAWVDNRGEGDTKEGPQRAAAHGHTVLRAITPRHTRTCTHKHTHTNRYTTRKNE